MNTVKLQIGLGICLFGVVLALSPIVNAQAVSSDATCDIDYAALKAAELKEIESGISVYRRFVLDGLSEDDLDEEEIQSLERMQELLDSRSRPADLQDLMILDEADARLSDTSAWDRFDDRVCEPQDETFSLYCSLYFASIDTIGEYQHRRTALQEVRFAIEDLTDGREFDHRMMDFNNLPETSFDDIKEVIETARTRVKERLDLQSECAL